MKILITILSLTYLINSAFAAETLEEKASAKASDVKREAKSQIHRAEEVICEKTDKVCMDKKAKNRAEEIKDYSKYKAKEIKNTIKDKKE